VPRLRSTSFRTFIVYPALVVAWELALNRGDLRFDPWFSPLLAWGFLQYWLIGRYRLPLGGGGQSVANALGEKILKGEIEKGFTVIRSSNGDVEFGLGVVEKGAHPTSPYRLDTKGKVVLANERSEVHQNQRDFIGPLEIPRGARLDLSLAIDGAPGIDVILIPRSMGEAWLQTYTTQAVTTPPPSLPLLDEPVYSGAVWRRSVSPPAGLYYVVLDNTATAGRTAPTGFAHDDRAALVSYAITLDD